MTKGPPYVLAGRLVERCQDMVDVADVEHGMLANDLVGSAP
ncbi:MAG: hypothetical protein ACRENE_17450 [Polyangiaceae bacterium]